MTPTFLNKNKLGISAFLFILSLGMSSFAQKADEVQVGNLWAPIVKVDGKASEWTTPLKASNKSTSLTYSLANDSKNLYLVIQSKESTNNSKIMLGGITLTINPDAKKKTKDGYTMTFPIINRVRRQNTQGARTPGQGGGGFGQGQQRTPEQRDSIQKAQVKTQLATAKDIKIFGFKGITDSLISVYNEFGIKASASIDDAGIFTYELAIPLGLLEMNIDKPKEFSYNIKVNGFQFNFGGGGDRQGGGARQSGAGGNSGGGGVGNRPSGFDGGGNNLNMQALMSPTDMWGKYTLATK
jgi:hypothetical protein